jgi:hypothetical protein
MPPDPPKSQGGSIEDGGGAALCCEYCDACARLCSASRPSKSSSPRPTEGMFISGMIAIACHATRDQGGTSVQYHDHISIRRESMQEHRGIRAERQSPSTSPDAKSCDRATRKRTHPCIYKASCVVTSSSPAMVEASWRGGIRGARILGSPVRSAEGDAPPEPDEKECSSRRPPVQRHKSAYHDDGTRS